MIHNKSRRTNAKKTAAWGVILALGLGLILSGCGDKDSGDSSTPPSVSKPTALSSDAAYDQAVAKLDAIIAYCDSHSGQVNDGIKAGATGMKSSMTSTSYSYSKSTYISAINTYIQNLQ